MGDYQRKGVQLMNNLTNLSNQLKQLIQNQNGQSFQNLMQVLDQSSLDTGNGSVDQTRENIAKIEAAIQKAIENLEGQQGTEPLMEQLNQLQVELMNASQSMEHDLLQQNQTKTIPGEPLKIDSDPVPGHPLS